MTKTTEATAASVDEQLRLVDLIDEIANGNEVYFKYVRSARDVMTSPVQRATLDDNVGGALEKMKEHRIRHLPVVDVDEATGSEAFIGIVSMRDVARQISKGLGSSGEAPTDEQALKGGVASILTRGPKSVDPDVGLFTVIQLMLDEKVDCVPVLENGRMAGIITSTDILRTFQRLDLLRQFGEGAAPRRKARLIDLKGGKRSMGASDLLQTHFARVSDLMSEDVLTLSPTSTLQEAMTLMQKHRVRHLPVVENDVIKGIVSDRDVLHALPPCGERAPSVGGNSTPAFRELLFATDANTDTDIEARLFMTGESRLFSAKATDSALDALNLMLKNQISSVLVVDANNKLEGIITSTDFMRGVLVLGQMLGSA